jgi:hypothetical protein
VADQKTNFLYNNNNDNIDNNNDIDGLNGVSKLWIEFKKVIIVKLLLLMQRSNSLTQEMGKLNASNSNNTKCQ